MITKDFLIEKFNKFISDELNSAAGYTLIANKLVGKDTKNVINELLEHAKEEFEHYQQLVTYASEHGFVDELQLKCENDVLYFEPNSLEETVKFIQKLETEAREDYREMVKIARENNAIELENFFTELMEDEIEHFNDLDYIFGDTRPVNEKLFKKIRNLV